MKKEMNLPGSSAMMKPFFKVSGVERAGWESGGKPMPYVSVRVVGKLSKEQKKKISGDIAESLFKHAQKAKDHTYVVFDEVAGENWAKGDQLFG